jgi:hypothetical protein
MQGGNGKKMNNREACYWIARISALEASRHVNQQQGELKNHAQIREEIMPK